MPDEVAILVPVLRRPHRVAPLLQSINRATDGPYRVLFLASPDDLEEHRAIRREGADMRIVDGNYAAKINHGVEATTEPLIFLAADDLEFHTGWLQAATALLTNRVGVVGTNDMCNARVVAGEHSTHSLVARWYTRLGTIDEPDKLLHEGYLHEFVDDEFVQTAQHRNAYAHAHDSIVEHLHPQVGKAPVDDLYAQQRRRMRYGAKVYRQRRALWATSTSQ